MSDGTSSPIRELRPFQRQALGILKNPGHLICISGTGTGKSLIYETKAKERGVRTLLVTPLVALARQQARKLREAGLNVCQGTGGAMTEIPDAGTDAWIVSPETLSYPTRQDVLRNWRPGFLVVDECHCLWEWGKDFRPSFSLLPKLVESVSIERSLWLTATLPPKARRDLRRQLPSPLTETGSFTLPDQLELNVLRVAWRDRAEALVSVVLKQNGAGIVFVGTREGSLRVARILHSIGKSVAVYHGGMSQEERRAVELKVGQAQVDVVVATSAFGMGMDYGHLTWVILWQAPPTLLSLSQAVGRVGRSGKSGRAYLFWDYEDFKLLEWSVQGYPDRQEDLLSTMGFLKSWNCRRTELIRYFSPEATAAACESSCDACRSAARPII